MTFLTPAALWGLTLIPVVIGLYALVIWRRSRHPLGALRQPMARRRHVPPALFALALAALLVSFARPEANLTLPTRTGQIMLAFDTSNSMLADDVAPTRLDAAKDLARNFVERQPGSVQVGVVAFTNGGLVVQAPTKNAIDVEAAIDRLSTDGGTSIGEGIFASLTAIADDAIAIDPEVIATDIDEVGIGVFSNAAIIVFTDGEEIGGADPVALASVAANAGVPVYTVGIGTLRGTVVALDGFSIATALDESLLSDIATATGGEYFLAANDPDLTGIFDDIDRRFERQGERIEVTALFAALAMALMIVAGVVSMRWFGRV